MSGAVPIITIKTENGPVDINMSDFDPAVHKVYQENKTAPAFSIAKSGKGKNVKFVIVDAEGKPVDENEFESIEEAEAALSEIAGV